MPPNRVAKYEGDADQGKHSDYLREYHLQGKEVTVTIEHVQFETMRSMRREEGDRGDEIKMIVVYFKDKSLGLGLSANCNIDSLKRLCGKKCKEWVGKKVCLYPATCNAFGDPKCPCIRIKAASIKKSTIS